MDGSFPYLLEKRDIAEVLGGDGHVALDGFGVVAGVIVGLGLLEALVGGHLRVHSGVFPHYLLQEVRGVLAGHSLGLLEVLNVCVHLNGQLGLAGVDETGLSFDEFSFIDQSLSLVDENRCY